MAEHLQKSFIALRHRRLGANRVTELALDGRERRFDVGPLRTLKEDVVRMRVTGDQKRALTDAAMREGLELPAWLRQLALRATRALPESK